MKSARLAAIMLALSAWVGLAGADQGTLKGSWKGPWYIGMSSGVVTVEIAEDGSGRIALTNMEDFGAQPVALAKRSFDGKTLKFSATGTSGTALVVSLQLVGANQLRGNGKYGGFGARLELQRAD